MSTKRNLGLLTARRSTAAISLFLATTAMPVWAEDAAASSADANAAADASAGADTADANADAAADTSAANQQQSGIADIVVTATKRETNLQKTPIAINVLNNEEMKKRHVESLYDLADGAIPSLRVATFEARQSALTVGIRGIVPLDANQPAREQGVGIYIDGIYLGRQHGLNAALFDIERIEVLKGPQGTLFGRNTEGGALSIVSRAPTGEFDLRALGGVGNYNSYNGELHVDFPAFANIAIKADGVVQHQDATTKNPLNGQAGWNYYNRRGGRLAARWTPSETLTNDIAFDISRDENTPFYSQLLNYNPNGCVATAAPQPSSPEIIPGACVLPGTNFTGGLTGTVKPLLPGVEVEGKHRMDEADIGVPQQVSVDKTWGVSNTLKWKVSPEIELRSITGYREVDATQWDNSGGAHRVPVVNLTASCTQAAPCNFGRYSLADLQQDQFSQEFQAVGSVGRLDYVAGLYYFREHVTDDASTPNSNAVYLNGAGQPVYIILDPCIGSGGFGSQRGCRSIDRASEVKSKSYAGYTQLTYHATDALHLTLGARYTHDEKKGELLMSRNLAYGPVPGWLADLAKPGFATATPAQLAAIGYEPLDKKWNRFNPMATIAYDFSPTIHGYAKYATGYRAGGASSRTSNYQAFDPEDVKSYELGLKTDFWDHRVRLNLAGYLMNRKDSQVDISTLQPTATGTFNNLVTINAPGTTKIRGFEADLIVRPIDNLQLSASYAYTYTHIPEVPITYTGTNGTTTTVDQQFYIVFTPRNAASGAIDYDLPIGSLGTHLQFHLDGNYAQATQAFDQFGTKADSSFIVNGRLSLADIQMGWEGSSLTLSLWGRNIFDEEHVYRRDPSNSLPSVQTSTALVGSINNVLGDYGNFNAPRTFGIEAAFKMKPPRRVVSEYVAPPPLPPQTVTCESGAVVVAPGACPPPPAPPAPPPPPAPEPERG